MVHNGYVPLWYELPFSTGISRSTVVDGIKPFIKQIPLGIAAVVGEIGEESQVYHIYAVPVLVADMIFFVEAMIFMNVGFLNGRRKRRGKGRER